MRSLACAAGVGLDDVAEDDAPLVVGLLLEALDALDDVDGVVEDPQAASANAASPARATALQRDESVEVIIIPSPCAMLLSTSYEDDGRSIGTRLTYAGRDAHRRHRGLRQHPPPTPRDR